jgi:hypothetical protein
MKKFFFVIIVQVSTPHSVYVLYNRQLSISPLSQALHHRPNVTSPAEKELLDSQFQTDFLTMEIPGDITSPGD